MYINSKSLKLLLHMPTEQKMANANIGTRGIRLIISQS